MVRPTVEPIMSARCGERITKFAIFESATSTSLTSRGRSMIADLPTPSERKRVFGATLGMLEVVAGAASLSAAVAGARPKIGASDAAENDNAPMSKVRSGVRLPLRAMFFVLLVIGALLVTSQSGRLDC